MHFKLFKLRLLIFVWLKIYITISINKSIAYSKTI